MTTPACEAASSTAAVAAAVPAHASAAAPAAAKAWKPRDPNLDHLTSSTFEHVYEPCEDSYLLMDALHADLIAADAASWISGGSYKRCLEVGRSRARSTAQCSKSDGPGRVCSSAAYGRVRLMAAVPIRLRSLSPASGPGSGIIISYLSQLLRRRGYFLAVDINPRACQTTRQTMRANGVVGDVLQGNLTDCIAARIEKQLVSRSCSRSQPGRAQHRRAKLCQLSSPA